jgi:hypothetical protein
MDRQTRETKAPAPSTRRRPKTNLEFADFACNNAREKCAWGSSNTRKEEWTAKKLKRHHMAGQKLDELREVVQPRDGDLERLEEIADLVTSTYKAGNCLEMCAVAFVLLMRAGVKPLAIVRHIRPGDHTFVVIGKANLEQVVNTEISGWGADVAICDPWANIAAPASTFDSVWEQRMVTWANRGKHVWFKAEEKYVSPAPGETWFSAINKNMREVSYKFE